MALGQAAGVAASIAIDDQAKVRNISTDTLQKYLLEQNATLIYYRDVPTSDKDFKVVQWMGLNGYLPDWEAMLDTPVDQKTILAWQKLSGITIKADAGQTLRREVLKDLSQQLMSSQTKAASAATH